MYPKISLGINSENITYKMQKPLDENSSQNPQNHFRLVLSLTTVPLYHCTHVPLYSLMMPHSDKNSVSTTRKWLLELNTSKKQLTYTNKKDKNKNKTYLPFLAYQFNQIY